MAKLSMKKIASFNDDEEEQGVLPKEIDEDTIGDKLANIESRRHVSSNKNAEADAADITRIFHEEYRMGAVSISELKPADDKWNFFGTPSKEKIYMLAASIVDNGLLQPIVVRTLPEGSDFKYEILAGHTRVAAYKLLREVYKDNKFSRIKAMIFRHEDINDLRAREIIIDTNYMQRGNLLPPLMARCIAAKAKILREQNQKRISEKICNEYSVQKTFLFKWLKISKLSDELLDYLGERNISSDCMYLLTRLPVEVQKRIYDEAKEFLTNNNIFRLKDHLEDDCDTIIEILKTKEPPKIKNVHFKVSSDLVRKKTDKGNLIYVEEGHFDELQEFLKTSKYCYLVASKVNDKKEKTKSDKEGSKDSSLNAAEEK